MRAWRRQGWLEQRTRWLFARGVPAKAELDVPTERHGIGSAAYNILSDRLSPGSIVYSFGVGCDVSFDVSLIERHGVEVHAFDPTAESATYLSTQTLPEHFHFHQWALGAHDGEATFSSVVPTTNEHYRAGTILKIGSRETTVVPTYTLPTIMDRLSHTQLEILKLDIEGSEFRLFEGLADYDLPVRQIIVELHPHISNIEHHRLMVGRHGWRRSLDFLEQLRSVGYRIFDISERGTEFALVRETR